MVREISTLGANTHDRDWFIWKARCYHVRRI